MAGEEGPICPQHPDQVRMRLTTLRSDLLRGGRLYGVYRCPRCGYERQVPVGDEGAAGGSQPASALRPAAL